MTAPKKLYWSKTPEDVATCPGYPDMHIPELHGVYYSEDDATETLGAEKWRARGCEVVKYVQSSTRWANTSEDVREVVYRGIRWRIKVLKDAMWKAKMEGKVCDVDVLKRHIEACEAALEQLSNG